MFSSFHFLLGSEDGELINLIHGSGGKFSLEISPSVTHAVLNNGDDEDWKRQLRTFSIPILKRKFVEDSVRNKKIMNMNPYVLIPREFIKSTLNRGIFEGYVFFLHEEKSFPSSAVGEIIKGGGSIVKTEYLSQNLDRIDQILNNDFQITFFVFSQPIHGFIMSDEVKDKKILEFLMTNDVNIVKKEWIEECVNVRSIIPPRDPRFEIKRKEITDLFSQAISGVKAEIHKFIDPNLNVPKFSVTTRVTISPSFSVNALILFRRIYNICDLDFLSLRVQFLAYEFIIELMIVASIYEHDRNFRPKLGEDEYFFILRMIYRSRIIQNVIEFIKKVRMSEKRKKLFFRFMNLLSFDHIRHVELKMFILENLLLFLDDCHELQNEQHLLILKLIQSDEFVSTFSHDPTAIDNPSGGVDRNIVLRFIQQKVCQTRIMDRMMEKVFANTIHNVPLVRKILRFKLADGLKNKNILIEIMLIQVQKYAMFILRNLGKIEKKQSNDSSIRRRRRNSSRSSRAGNQQQQYDESVNSGDEYHSFLLDILFSKFLINLPTELEKMRLRSILYLHLHLFNEKKLIHFDELVFELIGRERLDISFFENFSNRQVLLAKHYLKLMYYTRMRRFNEKEKIPIVKKFLGFRKEFEDHFFGRKRKRSNKRNKRKSVGGGGRAGSTHRQDSSSVIDEIKHKKDFRVNDAMVRANVKNSKYPDNGLDIVILTDEQSKNEKENELSEKYPELYTFEEEEEEEGEEDDEEKKKFEEIPGSGRKKKSSRRRLSVKKFKTPIIFTEDDFDSKRTFVHLGLKEVVFGLVQNDCYKCFTRIHPRMKCSKCDRVMCKSCFNAYIDEEAWENFLFSETFVCTECQNKKRKISEMYEGEGDDEGHIHKKRKLD